MRAFGIFTSKEARPFSPVYNEEGHRRFIDTQTYDPKHGNCRTGKPLDRILRVFNERQSTEDANV